MPLKAEETETSTTSTRAAELAVEIQDTQYSDTEHIIVVSPELSAMYDAANKVPANHHNQKLDNWRQNRWAYSFSQLPMEAI